MHTSGILNHPVLITLKLQHRCWQSGSEWNVLQATLPFPSPAILAQDHCKNHAAQPSQKRAVQGPVLKAITPRLTGMFSYRHLTCNLHGLGKLKESFCQFCNHWDSHWTRKSPEFCVVVQDLHLAMRNTAARGPSTVMGLPPPAASVHAGKMKCDQ